MTTHRKTLTNIRYARLMTVALLVLAGGAQADSRKEDDKDPIVGIWTANVQRRDCASGTVLAAFRGIDAFQLGGTLIDVGIAPPYTRNPALGFGTATASTTTSPSSSSHATWVMPQFFAEGRNVNQGRPS